MVATLAGSSALPAIADATWYEWQLRLLQRTTWRASKLRSLRRSQGWYRHRISMGIGRRISTASAGNCAGKNGLFQVAQKLLPTWANWTHRLRLMSRPTAPSWQVKSACDSTSQYSDYLAPHCRSLSQRIRPRQAVEKTSPPGSPKKHAKGRQYRQDRRGKRPGMRKPNSRDKSQQSTELFGAPIARDPILNDGVNVLHLHDTK